VAKETVRVNVTLSSESGQKLERLAQRTRVQKGTLAGSLLSRALDESDPDSDSIVEILDAIPGAFERAQQGLEEIQAGKGIPLENL
jgi:predicted RNA-binding protein (virulence factor B family)